MIEELYSLIEKSNLVVIGYTSHYERQKDAFISKLNPHIVDEFNETFSITQFLRNSKIENVLSESQAHTSKYVVIDSYCVRYQKGTPMFERSKFLRNLSERLRFESTKSGLVPIIVSTMYRDLSDNDTFNFSGGSGPMYASDLVIRFGEKGIKLIKSRYSGIFEIPYEELEDSRRELITLKNPNRFF
jgi:hypothetical protein